MSVRLPRAHSLQSFCSFVNLTALVYYRMLALEKKKDKCVMGLYALAAST